MRPCIRTLPGRSKKEKKEMNVVAFRNGVKMPQEGFGVFQIPDYQEAKRVVLEALDCGYRMVDTAAAYMNEKAVGDGTRESGVRREDVFVTSKIWVQEMCIRDRCIRSDQIRKSAGWGKLLSVSGSGGIQQPHL